MILIIVQRVPFCTIFSLTLQNPRVDMGRHKIGKKEREKREADGRRLRVVLGIRGISARQLWKDLVADGVPGIKDRSTVVKILAGKTGPSDVVMIAMRKRLRITQAMQLEEIAERQRVIQAQGEDLIDEDLVRRYSPLDVKTTRGLPHDRRLAVLRFSMLLDDAPIRPVSGGRGKRTELAKPFVSSGQRSDILQAAGDYLETCEKAVLKARSQGVAQLPDGFAYTQWSSAVLSTFANTLTSP